MERACALLADGDGVVHLLARHESVQLRGVCLQADADHREALSGVLLRQRRQVREDRSARPAPCARARLSLHHRCLCRQLGIKASDL